MLPSLEYLLQRYADKNCTEEEKVQLMQLLQQPENDEAVQQLIDKMMQEREPRYAMPDDAAEAVLHTILQTGKAPVISIDDNGNRKRSVWLRVAAAAIITLFLAVGGWLWLNKTPSNDTVKTEEKKSISNDRLPGGNKALLTLDDGSTIVLDSTSNGVVAQQGGATILKTGNGQLAYDIATNESSKVLYNTLSIPRGGQYQLMLPDGSKVWLNSLSSIRYPTTFIGKERRIELSGEAYFEVAKNAAMPFKVSVDGKAEVEVLGTHFNINSYTDEPTVNTTLLEGSVRVTGLETRDSKLIVPGEQVQLKKNGQLSVNKNANIEQVMAWKNGIFNFDGADLPMLLRQLSRWYDIDIVYEGPVPQREFGGKMQRDLNLSQTLRILKTNNVNYRIEKQKLIIMK
ncbi:FecR domain-containing protein [Lacibacter sp. H407]|uniref:FecR domain-containing protein n=1 Tax=Lacibacter sp. H407 TaxID=3133423 RepID=UPI0030C580A5